MEQHNVSISFYGFEASELDTIYTTGYARGSGFGTVTREKQTDGISTYRNSDSSYMFESSSHNSLSDDQDWVVYIPAANKTYLISGYEYSSYRCNNCPLDKEDKIRSLSQCTINGTKQSATPGMIYK